ncbi:MAG: ABC transporter substrate-binding protein [Hyphomicrobiaceae bacterium]
MDRKSSRPRELVSTGRRQFIRNAAAGAALSAAGTSVIPRTLFAQTQKKVSFTLPWLPNGASLFAFVAKDKGFWSKRGLDVDITRGFGSVASAQAIAQGKFDFGMSAAPTYYLQTLKGMKIISLACSTYDPLMSVMYLESSGIKAPKDLENTKMGCVVASGEYPFLPVFAKNAKFDLSKVSIVQTDNKIRTTLLLSKQVKAISGFAASVVPSVSAKGIPIRAFLYSKYGMKFYGQMLLTQPSRLASDKGTCEAFTEGAMEAAKWTMLNPEEALNIFFKYVKEAALTKSARDGMTIELGMFALVNFADDVQQHGMGYTDLKSYDEMGKLVMDAMAKPGEKAPELAGIITNDFVTDKFKFSPAEWSQVQEYIKPYAEML